MHINRLGDFNGFLGQLVRFGGDASATRPTTTGGFINPRWREAQDSPVVARERGPSGTGEKDGVCAPAGYADLVIAYV